jgi:surfeit locus 1 family protein
MTLFVMVMLPTVVSLGLWQLDRAALKRSYEARYFDRMAEPARPVPTNLANMAFLRVSLSGAFDRERYFLVDNQIHEGRSGYWVVAVFAADDGRKFLVNRGWVEAPQFRDQLPSVRVPAGAVTTTGVIWPDTGMVPLLAEDPWAEGWPKRVQRLDIDSMARAVGDEVPAIELRLEAGQPGVDVAATLGHDFKAETHEGYAAQWFGLGGVLIIGYIVFGLRRHE